MFKINSKTIKAAAIEEQKQVLIEEQKFSTEYMVYFDPQKAEGPYNDVYLFCYIKHGVISKETKIFEKGTKKIQRAGECRDLEDFFKLFPQVDSDTALNDNQQNSKEVALHKAWDGKLSKELIDIFLENADLFDNDEIDEDILESIYSQTESFNKEEGEVHFQVSDFGGYAKDDLTSKQNEALQNLAKGVLGFLLHKKWDGTLPEELIDQLVEVAELFDDPYEADRIDRKICRFAYKIHKRGERRIHTVDHLQERLEDLLADDVKVTPNQEKILHQIATLLRDYINS